MPHADQAMVDQLCSIRCLLEAAEDRVIDVFFVTLPEAGGTRTFFTGTTRIDYAAGTIINPDGSVEQITRKLDDVQNKSVMHSISIYAEDAALIFALDGSGKQTVQQQFLFQLPYVTFTKIQIICTEDTEVNLFACTNPQATLGNFRLTQITDITQPYIVAEDPELTTWPATLVSLSNNMSRIRNQIISITGESWGTVSNSIASILNTSSGHDHDGTDSKKVSAGSVNNTPDGNIIATNVQGAITELDGQDTTHAADTSTHGVNEVADVATVSAEIDSDINTHAAIKSANAVLGHVIVETTSDIDVDASGKLTLGNHAGNHTDGTDDIQNATSGQKGLATAAQITKLDGIDTGAKDDQTGAEIKAAYEGEADTNAYDNAAVSKLGGIEASADITDATNIASSIVGTAAKATPVDADTVPLIDSVDGSSLKEVLWSQIKATLKSYFDTLYDVAGGLSTHEADTTTHGTTGDIVGTSDTQAITTKTIDSSAIGSTTPSTGVFTTVQGTTLNNLMASKAIFDILGLMTDPRCLYMQFEDPGAGTLYDASGQGHNGTYQGSMTTSDRIMKGMGWAIDFDGNNDHIDFGDHNDFSFGDASNDSPATWFGVIEVELNANNEMVCSKMNAFTNSKEYFIELDATEILKLRLYDESAGVYCTRAIDAALSAIFHSYFITYSGAGGATAGDHIKIYIDGVLVASTATNDVNYVAMENTTASLNLGAYTDSGGNHANFWSNKMSFFGVDGTEHSAYDAHRFHQLMKGLYGL